ncbi:MAG: hypothetical protein QY325_11820 [Flavobacteriales bacterium]|nr:MAG: hypothetical protein QY325_11820 [Flavobacteriales bacterium]
MKTNALLTVLLAILLCASARQAQGQEVLTNADLIQLAELGMGESIILSRVETAANTFDVSTSALIALKRAGLTDPVLAAVVKAANDPARKAVDANDPKAPHRPGIYYFDEAGQLVELLPTVASQGKDKGRLATALTYGLAKTTVVARISGAQARAQLPAAREFYFYFNQQQAAFDQNSIAFYGFQQATSPNEFTLARLDETAGAREIEMGSANAFSSEDGIDEKHARSFDIEQLAPGIFKVTPQNLEAGEYCFVYAGGSAHGHGPNKLFDFGVGKVSGTGVISRQ